MNWYLIVKFLHIIAVTITIGGMFARQLVRGIAQKSDDIKSISSLTHVAIRNDRLMVIPWSTLMFLLGVLLAAIQKWPILGFLQGSSQNWLLVSNILLVVMIVLIPIVFVPYNKKVESILQVALAEGHMTSDLTNILHDKTNKLAHYAEEAIVIVITALMVLKPF